MDRLGWVRRRAGVGLFAAAAAGCAGTPSGGAANAAPTVQVAAAEWDRCPAPPADLPPDTVRRPLINEYPLAGSYAVVYFIDGRYAGTSFRGGAAAWAAPVELTPADVEEVVVLKAAQADEQYGVCPGVGVVQIRTKGGGWRPVPSAGAAGQDRRAPT